MKTYHPLFHTRMRSIQQKPKLMFNDIFIGDGCGKRSQQ
jgi:hypothetical protein